MKLTIGLGVALVTLAFGGFASLGARGVATPQVPTMTVRKGDFVHEVTAEGNLAAVRSTTLTVPVSSQRRYVIDWVAPDAIVVAEDQLIVRFDRSEMEKSLEDGQGERDTALNKIRKEVAESESAVRNLGRDFESARLSLDAAEKFQAIDPELHSRTEIIASEIDATLAHERTSHLETTLERRKLEAKKQTDILDIEKRQALTAIERAEQGLAATEVRAPHDGILQLQRDWRGQTIRAGQTVWQGQELAKIPDLTAMEAEVHVLEADAGGLAVGKTARVIVEAHPELSFAATVRRVDDLAKPRVRGVPVQYFGVTLELGETDPSIMKPGQRIRAMLLLESLEDVITIPRQAVFDRDGQSVAHVLRGESFHAVPLKLGPATPGRIVIVDGLAPGDRIALREPDSSL